MKCRYNWKLSRRSKNRLNGVDESLIRVVNRGLTICPIDFGIPEYGGLRTAKEQGKLYLEEASDCDGVDKVSNHQAAEDGYGKAVDFFAYVNGKASWERHHLAMVNLAFAQAAMIENVRIEMGIMWMGKNPIVINEVPYGWDAGHIELL